MASPIEQAVVELQIIVREFNRRLHALEQRLGIEHEPIAPRAERAQTTTSPPPQERRASFISRTTSLGQGSSEGAGAATLTPVHPLASQSAPPPPSPAPEIQVRLSETKSVAAPSSVPRLVEEFPDEIIQEVSREIGAIPPPLPGVVPAPPPPAVRVLEFIQTRLPIEPSPGPELEFTLGTAVASWLGALTILAAVLVFLTYTAETGPGPLPRVILSLVAGFSMIVLGQWFHMRSLRPLSAALSAVGLAAMMAALVAAGASFNPPILPPFQVFMILPAVGAFGMLLALFNRSQALAILSLLGAYASPVALAYTDNSLPLLLCIFVITCLALALVTLRREWESIRIIAFAASWIWLIAWSNGGFASSHATLGILIISGLFLLFFAELTFNLLRALAEDPAQSAPATPAARFTEAFVTLESLLNTGLAFSAASLIFFQAQVPGLWAFSLALAVFVAALALTIPSGVFSICAVTQAFALVVLTIALGDRGTTIAYAGFALAFGLYGGYWRPRNIQFALAWMFGLLVVLAIRIFAYDAVDPWMQKDLLALAGFKVTLWMLSGWAAAALALALAYLSRPGKILRADGTTRIYGATWATVGCIAVATALVVVVNIRALPPHGAFTLASALWILALMGLARPASLAHIAPAVETLAASLLMLLSLKWLVLDGIDPEINNPSAITPPILDFFTLNALLLIAILFLLRPFHQAPAVGGRLVAWWITALTFVWLNIQTLRSIDYFIPQSIAGVGSPELVKNLSLSALWALFACGMIILGFIRNSPSVRYVALIVLGFTLAKILFLDMAASQTSLRVYLLLMVGVLLFIISFLYHKSIQKPSTTSG